MAVLDTGNMTAGDSASLSKFLLSKTLLSPDPSKPDAKEPQASRFSRLRLDARSHVVSESMLSQSGVAPNSTSVLHCGGFWLLGRAHIDKDLSMIGGFHFGVRELAPIFRCQKLASAHGEWHGLLRAAESGGKLGKTGLQTASRERLFLSEVSEKG